MGNRRIFVGGQFTTIGGQMRNRIARLDPDTGLADQYNPDANGTVRVINPPVESNHGIVSVIVGGAFTNIGGQVRNHIAQLQTFMGGGAVCFGIHPMWRDRMSTHCAARQLQVLVGVLHRHRWTAAQQHRPTRQ